MNGRSPKTQALIANVWRSLKLAVRLGLALFVLLVGLLSTVPNRQCHCSDTKPIQTLKDTCPFGKLRSLSGTIALLEPATVSSGAIVTIPAPIFFYSLTVADSNQDAAARSPPF